jgi:hypothetical protein
MRNNQRIPRGSFRLESCNCGRYIRHALVRQRPRHPRQFLPKHFRNSSMAVGLLFSEANIARASNRRKTHIETRVPLDLNAMIALR